MKYIDADLLRKEIEHRIDILGEVSVKQQKKGDSEMFTYYYGKAISLEELLSFIKTMEEQDFPTTDEETEQFLATHPKIKVPEKYKTPDWVFVKSEMPITPEEAMKKLDEKIALVKERGTWDGVDVDKYMDEVRGREPSLPSDVDEAAKEYAKTTFKKPYSDNPDEEVTIVEPDKYAGFIAGAKWDREQMMSKAVKSEVTETCGISSVWIKTQQFKPGQKVRIIIVKEDSHE